MLGPTVTTCFGKDRVKGRPLQKHTGNGGDPPKKGEGLGRTALQTGPVNHPALCKALVCFNLENIKPQQTTIEQIIPYSSSTYPNPDSGSTTCPPPPVLLPPGSLGPAGLTVHHRFSRVQPGKMPGKMTDKMNKKPPIFAHCYEVMVPPRPLTTMTTNI